MQIQFYIEQLIALEEIVEVPGVEEQIERIKVEVCEKFTAGERAAAGLTF